MSLTKTESPEVLKQWISAGMKGAMTYDEYRALIDKLILENKSTGQVQDDHLLEVSKLNVHRMNRWDKHYSPSDAIVQSVTSITEKFTWLIITEGWCGDSAQIVPALHALASANKNITERYVLRDDNLVLMDLFLTKGKRSIPKVICLDSDNQIVWTWGPRPAEIHTYMEELQASGMEMSQIKEKVHLMYAKNKQQALEADLNDLLKMMR